jgi:hypothetical protein
LIDTNPKLDFQHVSGQTFFEIVDLYRQICYLDFYYFVLDSIFLLFCCSGVIGFVVPVLIGAITTDNMTFSAWKLVFGLAAGIYTVGNLVYVFSIEGKPQSWNFPEQTNSDENGAEDANEEKLILAPKAEQEETDRI